MKNVSAIAFALALSTCPAFAGSLDQASQTALGQTQQMLNDPSQRAQAVKDGGTDAHLVDQQVRSLAGSTGGVDAIYGGAAQAMGELTHRTGGDSKQMTDLINAAKANPEAFANSLSPEMKAKIHEIANQISPPAAPAARP